MPAQVCFLWRDGMVGGFWDRWSSYSVLSSCYLQTILNKTPNNFTLFYALKPFKPPKLQWHSETIPLSPRNPLNIFWQQVDDRCDQPRSGAATPELWEREQARVTGSWLCLFCHFFVFFWSIYECFSLVWLYMALACLPSSSGSSGWSFLSFFGVSELVWECRTHFDFGLFLWFMILCFFLFRASKANPQLACICWVQMPQQAELTRLGRSDSVGEMSQTSNSSFHPLFGRGRTKVNRFGAFYLVHRFVERQCHNMKQTPFNLWLWVLKWRPFKIDDAKRPRDLRFWPRQTTVPRSRAQPLDRQWGNFRWQKTYF